LRAELVVVRPQREKLIGRRLELAAGGDQFVVEQLNLLPRLGE
jgi:hypothetical protein